MLYLLEDIVERNSPPTDEKKTGKRPPTGKQATDGDVTGLASLLMGKQG